MITLHAIHGSQVFHVASRDPKGGPLCGRGKDSAVVPVRVPGGDDARRAFTEKRSRRVCASCAKLLRVELTAAESDAYAYAQVLSGMVAFPDEPRRALGMHAENVAYGMMTAGLLEHLGTQGYALTDYGRRAAGMEADYTVVGDAERALTDMVENYAPLPDFSEPVTPAMVKALAQVKRTGHLAMHRTTARAVQRRGYVEAERYPDGSTGDVRWRATLTDAGRSALRAAVDAAHAEALVMRAVVDDTTEFRPEFPAGLKLRNPQTGATFEVIEHTHAVRLRNLRTDAMSAIPQEMAREFERQGDLGQVEDIDIAHDQAIREDDRRTTDTLTAKGLIFGAVLPSPGDEGDRRYPVKLAPRTPDDDTPWIGVNDDGSMIELDDADKELGITTTRFAHHEIEPFATAEQAVYSHLPHNFAKLDSTLSVEQKRLIDGDPTDTVAGVIRVVGVDGLPHTFAELEELKTLGLVYVGGQSVWLTRRGWNLATYRRVFALDRPQPVPTGQTNAGLTAPDDDSVRCGNTWVVPNQSGPSTCDVRVAPGEAHLGPCYDSVRRLWAPMAFRVVVQAFAMQPQDVYFIEHPRGNKVWRVANTVEVQTVSGDSRLAYVEVCYYGQTDGVPDTWDVGDRVLVIRTVASSDTRSGR